MFAIIKTGGKQYKIKENDIIFVEKLKNKNIGKKFADEGFKTVKKKFRLKKTINQHEKEYLKCLRSWHKKL